MNFHPNLVTLYFFHVVVNMATEISQPCPSALSLSLDIFHWPLKGLGTTRNLGSWSRGLTAITLRFIFVVGVIDNK